MRLYRPSNGTEGEWFMSEHCCQCIHDNPDYESASPRCDILTAAMCCSIGDKDYPKEWCYGEDGKPTCTKWRKWNWGNDGDPNDPDNPKYRPPDLDNPNQFMLPFIFDEIGVPKTQLETA